LAFSPHCEHVFTRDVVVTRSVIVAEFEVPNDVDTFADALIFMDFDCCMEDE
jgi:hypothetical protein